ncbi:agmatine deiminase family protein [Maridesulfovibrio salexigens]|uniref:Agmatine deiminase n=1 Tax=Maridesulfovibrio salexigens (strain ATCC 14822 / DSM 2638 / NCIMB 8403 / VKM B-1763) TaxID=526222 RepID=C6C0U5_MARSD|nr:agmatine deiminase family protein [Maridesulfovibrio salexigens]ACS81042.1 Agmatine deiminase [Maridesulfovibrio salexigens DSM 2638]
MTKLGRAYLLAIAFLLAATVTAAAAEWRFPGEFEKQERVYLGWLSKEYVKGYQTDTVLLEIAKNLAPYTKITVCVPEERHLKHVQSLLKKNKLPMDKISFQTIPFTMLYWRDFGPIFTTDKQGNKSIADFSFNCWGYFPQSDTQSRIMERVDRDIAKVRNIPSRMTRLVSEGGDRELNGKGTLLVTEACEFQRNPNLSRADIEVELKEMLGVTNIIWLKKGTVDDDAYNVSTLPGPDGKGVAYRSAAANNHIDEYCRFVSPDTILLAEVSEEEAAQGPVEAENRRRMEENYRILKKAVDQDGKPFKIIRIPMPETLYFEVTPQDEAYYGLVSFPRFSDGTAFPVGQSVQVVPAQSYCNFLISNGVVLAQKYWHEGLPEKVKERDAEALEVLKKAFPNRKVVTINTLGINFGGGGIHCSTQQEPYTGK